VGENFAWNGEQCDWPVAATVCYGAFAFVQRDEDPVLPVYYCTIIICITFNRKIIIFGKHVRLLVKVS